MEKLNADFENWSNEKLWNYIWQRTISEGAVVRIEDENGEVIEESLPLDRSMIEACSIGDRRYIMLCYHKMTDGHRINKIIATERQRPTVNSDFSKIAFRDSKTSPQSTPNNPIIDYQFVFIEREVDHEKPKVVYHGSASGDIKLFEPKTAAEGDLRNEPAAVYATPNIRIAIQSMANRFASNGGIVNGRNFVCIPMTQKEFETVDAGGYIYELPSENFNPNNGLGFGDDEWVSTEPIIPTNQTFYPSILTELKKCGVDVFFIKPDQVTEITNLQNQSNPEHLETYLYNLSKI